MRGRPKNSQNVAPRIRAAFFKAIENLKERPGGIADLSDIFEQLIVTDPYRAFEILAKFTPKEIEVDQDTTHRIISGDALTLEEWEAEHLAGPPIEDTTH